MVPTSGAKESCCITDQVDAAAAMGVGKPALRIHRSGCQLKALLLLALFPVEGRGEAPPSLPTRFRPASKCLQSLVGLLTDIGALVADRC